MATSDDGTDLSLANVLTCDDNNMKETGDCGCLGNETLSHLPDITVVISSGLSHRGNTAENGGKNDLASRRKVSYI